VSGCGTAAYCGTVGMVRGTGVPSGGGVVVMGMAGVTMLQPREMGKSELSPSLEVELSSPVDSSRMACSDGEPLRATTMNTEHESFPLGESLRLSER
jgi:hypothetical protein